MTAIDLTQSGNWVPPPSKFYLLSPGESHIEGLNQLSFLSVAFRPLKKEAFYLETEGVHGGAITQWHTTAPFGFVSAPKLALDKITVRFVTQGSIIRRNAYSDHLGAPGTGMFVAFDEMVAEEASEGFSAFAGTIDRAALLSCHIALEGSDEQPFPKFQPVVDATGAPMRAFRHNFHLVYMRRHAGSNEIDLNSSLYEEMVMYQFLTVWPKATKDRTQGTVLRPSWQTRHAMEYIEANLQRRITLAEIAAVARIGVRSLQLGFRRELGKTPIQWILERRLSKVHNDLLTASSDDASIKTIARRWGFVHMGDFSRRYRELYGETAVQTKRLR